MNIEIDPYLKTKTCMYVEDDMDIYSLFFPILNKIFKKVYIAKNGAEGLDLFKQKNPDIVLSDIKMPEMNGLEMAYKIKAIDHKTPIMLITAFTDIDFLKKALDINIDAYVTKPLNKKKFFLKLNEIANKLKSEKK